VRRKSIVVRDLGHVVRATLSIRPSVDQYSQLTAALCPWSIFTTSNHHGCVHPELD